MSSIVTLICPRLTCRAVLRVPEEVRGQRVRCAECGVTFLVPLAKGRAAAPPTPPPEPKATNAS